jgi:hypothetical protein
MKKFKSLFIYSLLAGLLFASCSNDETKITYLGGGTPTLGVSSTADLVLSKAQENFSSLQFQWTNPNYSFSNGSNTQDVYYSLQIDTTGSNFSNPKMATISYTNDVNHIFTVKELNTALSNLELPDFKVHPFEFRIKATLANGKEPQLSNVIKINITTYLDVVYPVPANLYITGSATPGGWQAGTAGEAVPAGQQFTKINSYSFQINSLALTFNGTADGNNGFLLLPVYGSWSAKYGFTGAKHANNGSGDTFKPDGNDFAPPSPSGNYKIVVNFKTGKYTMTQL